MTCRHPAAVQRPTFADLQISLQQPKWSEEDKATYSENARTIGARESVHQVAKILSTYTLKNIVEEFCSTC